MQNPPLPRSIEHCPSCFSACVDKQHVDGRFKRHALGQIERRPKFSGRQQFEDQVEP
jgi:hypothetical protein